MRDNSLQSAFLSVRRALSFCQQVGAEQLGKSWNCFNQHDERLLTTYNKLEDFTQSSSSMIAQPAPRARSRQGGGAGAPLPDFETLLASEGSTIRVRASQDRQRDSSDGDADGDEELLDEEEEEEVPPTPPRKAGGARGGIAFGSSNMAVKGREAALRDIEREMALDEVLEDGEGDEDCVSDDDDEESKQVPPQRSQHQQDKQHQIQDRAPAGTSLPDDDKSTSTITINASNTQRIAGSAPLPTSSDKALPMSPPDLVEQDLRRRSQYRTPGLATSPDLATLVKTAKANSNGQINAFAPPQQPVAGPSGTNALSSTTSTATTSPQERPSASPVVTVRGHGSPRSRVSSDSGSRRYTPTLTTVSSLQAAMDMPRTRAVSTRSDSGTSFVHVNSNGNVPLRISSLTQVPSSNSNGVPPAPSTLSTIPDSDLGTVTSVWSGGSTSRKSKKLTKGGGDENVSL